MGGLRLVLCALGGIGLASCASNTSMDLAENPRLYRLTGYSARTPSDLAVYVAPVIDARPERVAAEASGSHIVSYFSDARWARPVADMVEAVLRQEVTRSGVFDEVLGAPAPEAGVLRAQLLVFDVGVEGHVTGWRSFAKVALSVRLVGPPGPDGKRPVLLEDRLEHTAASQIAWRPTPGAILAGVCVREVMGKLLRACDQASVGQAKMPR